MKKFIMGFVLGALLFSFSSVYAATGLNIMLNPYPVLINGIQTIVEGYNINDYTFLKLADFKKAGLTVKFNETEQQIEVTSPQTTSLNNQLNSSNSMVVGKVTIKINKVIQDSDSLRLYITYSNGSNEQIITGDSLAKIVFNGKQYEYDSNFNFDRYYEKDIKAPDFIEPGVTADSVIFFPPINNIDKINVVLNADFESYRFNNIDVTSLQTVIPTTPTITPNSPSTTAQETNSVNKISLDETKNYSDWISTTELRNQYNVFYTDTLNMSDMSKSCDALLENKTTKAKVSFVMPGYNYKEDALYQVIIGQNRFLMWTRFTHDYYFRISELQKLGLL